MNRDKAYILDTIDEYRRSASAQDTGEYFEPVFLSFPQKVTIKCPHCGKNQKIDGVTLWPNGGMMGVDDLPADDISIIANCSGCGTRIAMSRNSVKKSMEARGSMMRTLVLLVIILAVALGVGGFTLFKVQSEKYFREGSTALRSQQYEQAVEALTKASDWGSADALYLLSECYRSGNGVAADEAMADELFAKALEKGSGYAMYDQAMKSFDTYIETADQTALNDCIEGLQESDAPDAKYQLSLLTRSGIGVKVDTEQADSLLREAAEAGSVDALCDMAQVLMYEQGAQTALDFLYDYGDPDDPDIMAAEGYVRLFSDSSSGTTLLNQAAEAGSSWANYYWGEIYYNSLLTGTSRDVDTAQSYFQAASDAGNYRGRYELALCLSVRGDTENAVAMATECYNRGYGEAGCVIAGNMSDDTKKLDYMNQAADLNYAPAEVWMAWYYHDKDQGKCETYLQRAYLHGARYEANAAAQDYFDTGIDYFGSSTLN